MLSELFLMLILLQVKHWYIDFVNQSEQEVQWKGTYLDWRGMKHSVKHGIATMLIMCFFIDFPSALVLGVMDAILHYHIDWAKMNINKKYNYTIDNPKFWAWLGADQLAHQITYIGLVWLLFV